MKNIFKIFLAATIILVAGCTEPDDIITGNAKTGAFLSLSGSGSLAGSPEAGADIEDATITFQETILNYQVEVASGIEEVNQLTVYKSYKGETVEVTSVSASEGVNIEFTQVSEFLSGFSGVAESDLRVGDMILFYTETEMKDGRVLRDKAADLGVSISCLADLSGTYLATNDECNPTPFEVTITKNPDGSYYLTVADGGFLSKCTSNTTLANAGTIVEQCGEILPSTALDFGTDGGYGIGDILGGSWDAENGILTMEHKDVFFNGGPYEWTSTYVRQ